MTKDGLDRVARDRQKMRYQKTTENREEKDADTHNQISAGSCQLIGTVQMVNGGEKAIERTKSS